MKIINKKNYLISLKQAEDISIFRNVYAEVDGQEKDLTEDGMFSCALFVSNFLLRFSSITMKFILVNEIHITVSGLVNDLVRNNWYKINEPKPGAIVVWKNDIKGLNHPHIGFYIEDGITLSTDPYKKTTTYHPMTQNGQEVDYFLWHDFLN